MKTCCECNGLVWPWQQSIVSASPIHAKCHQKVIDEACRDANVAIAMRGEMEAFQLRTGIEPNIRIPKQR